MKITKVLILAGYAPSLLNFRRQLLEAMVKQGCEVVAAAPEIDDEVRNGLAELGVRSVQVSLNRTGMNPLRDVVSVLHLYRLFVAERPDIFLGYTIKPVVLGSLAARFAGVPHIASMITGLGYAFFGETWRQRVAGAAARQLYRKALRYNRTVFFQNSDDLESFISLGLLGSSPKAVLINGSGVDLGYFPFCPPVTGASVFLLIARLYLEKGIREYVTAARELKRRYPTARFLLVGAPDSNPSSICESEIRSWVEEGLIEWRGAVSDVRPHIMECSVYVLPSYREGTPRSVLEAMAMGRPIVTTNAPGCRQTVVDGVSGILVPVRDSIALAAAMERFILEPDLVGQFGREARLRAEQCFEVHAVSNRVINYLGIPCTPRMD